MHREKTPNEEQEPVIVHAIIRHPEDPSSYLVDDNDKFPSIPHEHGDGTYEDTLRKLGAKWLGISTLTPEQRSLEFPGQPGEKIDGIAYLTDNLGKIALPKGLRWLRVHKDDLEIE